MIKLRIEDYCENCDRFDPRVEIKHSYKDPTASIRGAELESIYDTHVFCKHWRDCADVVERFQKGTVSR